MKTRPYTKLVGEGEYIAQVDVELIETDTGWSPYLSLDDAFKLGYLLDFREDAMKPGITRRANALDE